MKSLCWRWTAALFSLLACGVLAGCRDQGWTAWRGPRGDGIARVGVIADHWAGSGPRLLWRRPLGTGFSAIIAASGRLWTAWGDGRRDYCGALDATTGKEIWRRPLGAFLDSSVGGGPRATPALDAGRIFAVGSRGDLWCLEAVSGKPVWHVDLRAAFRAETPIYGVASSPVIYKDLLLYGAGGPAGHSVVALDKQSGRLRWAAGNDPPSYSTPVVRHILGREQAVFFTGRGAMGIDPESGTILWRYDWQTPGNANVLTPVVEDDRIFLSSGYGVGAALLRLDRQGANLRVTRVWEDPEFEGHFSSPIVWRGDLYGFSGSALACVDLERGEVRWSQRGFQHGTVLGLSSGQMIVLGYKCALALIDLDPRTYRERGRSVAFASARCLTVPTVDAGHLYLRNEREIAALDLTRP